MFAADGANPWIAEVGRALRAPPLARLVLAVAAIGGVAWLVRLGDSRLSLGPGSPWLSPVGPALTALAFGLLGVAGLALDRRRLLRREPLGRGALAGGFAFGFGGVCASLALASVAGHVSIIAAAGPPAAWPRALAGLALAAVAAAAQETCFRAWLQPVACARLGPWAGLVASATIFALTLQLAGLGNDAVLGLLDLWLLGLLCGILALRTGGLAAAIGANLGWRWTEAGLFSTTPAQPGFISLRLEGAPLWTGNDAGVVGSLAGAVVLVLLFVTLLSSRPAMPQPAHGA